MAKHIISARIQDLLPLTLALSSQTRPYKSLTSDQSWTSTFRAQFSDTQIHLYTHIAAAVVVTIPVPWTPRACASILLNGFQSEWIFIAKTVITATKTNNLDLLQNNHSCPQSTGTNPDWSLITTQCTHCSAVILFYFIFFWFNLIWFFLFFTYFVYDLHANNNNNNWLNSWTDISNEANTSAHPVY